MVSVGVLYLLATVLAVHAQEDCPRPRNGPANTVLVSADIVKDTFPDGATAGWECEAGYSQVGGSRRQRCTAGTWDPAIVTLQCDRRTCGSIPEPDNGRIDFPDGSQFGDMAVIVCNAGHNLVGGAKQRSCGADGNWMGRFGRCEVVKCGKPDDTLNGKYSPVREDYDYGFVVTYTCDKSFTLVGARSLDCQTDGQWLAPPTCKVVECPAPDVEHLSRVQGGPPPYGYKSHVTYKCDAGFQMEGSPSVTCEISGSWSPPIPTCKVVKCGKPDDILNGKYSPVREDYDYGFVVTYTCDNKSFTLVGPRSLDCQTDGQWLAPPTCKGNGVDPTPPPSKTVWIIVVVVLCCVAAIIGLVALKCFKDKKRSMCSISTDDGPL